MSDAELRSSTRPARATFEEVGSWLRARIAFYVELPASEITSNLSLSRAGLDSVYAFALCAEIEDELSVQVEPTLLWDLDTPEEVTAYLVQAVSQIEVPDAGR